jgi:hypothetical protein
VNVAAPVATYVHTTVVVPVHPFVIAPADSIETNPDTATAPTARPYAAATAPTRLRTRIITALPTL